MTISARAIEPAIFHAAAAAYCAGDGRKRRRLSGAPIRAAVWISRQSRAMRRWRCNISRRSSGHGRARWRSGSEWPRELTLSQTVDSITRDRREHSTRLRPALRTLDQRQCVPVACGAARSRRCATSPCWAEPISRRSCRADGQLGKFSVRRRGTRRVRGLEDVAAVARTRRRGVSRGSESRGGRGLRVARLGGRVAYQRAQSDRA